jgi:hypothetical protein
LARLTFAIAILFLRRFQFRARAFQAPILRYGVKQMFDFPERYRFYHVRVRAKFVSAIDVRWIVGGRDNDDWDPSQWPAIALHPLQNFKPGLPGHFDVHDNQLRKRVTFPVRIAAIPAQIINCLLPVRNHLQRVAYPRNFEGSFNEKNIVQIVFNEQNRKIVLVHINFYEPSTLNLLEQGLNARWVIDGGGAVLRFTFRSDTVKTRLC